jgi:hypothetical protein
MQTIMRPVVWTVILFECILIVLAWAIGALVGISPWQEIKLTWLAVVWSVLAALPLLGGLVWTIHTRWTIFVQLRRYVQKRVVPLFAGCSLFELALISGFAGIGEEIFFRGLLQTGLTAATSVWIGLGLTSLIFGLAHFISLMYAVLAALIGLYLGILFIAFDNLAVPVIVHALYDFVALTYLVRMRSAANDIHAAAER